MTSSQDGGTGGHTVPPRTTKEGKQQFKNKKQPLKENQTVWKSDNQEIKKKQSPRPVGGAERTHTKAVASRLSQVADCGVGWAKMQLAARQQLGDTATDCATQSSSMGK